MNYTANVVVLEHLRPHPNANKVQIADIMGNQVIVSIDSKPGDLGIFFEVDTQLSVTFLKENNLYTDPLKNKDLKTKGYISNNGRIRARVFRGEKSEGLWLPFSYLDYLKEQFGVTDLELQQTTKDTEFFSIGTHRICQRYSLPVGNGKQFSRRKGIEKRVPYFYKHVSTEQLFKAFPKLDLSDVEKLIVTEKLHGTSIRIGNTMYYKPQSFYNTLITTLGFFLVELLTTFRFTFSWKYFKTLPYYNLIIGSRNVVKDFGTDDLYTQCAEDLEATLDNLKEGEILYGELIGYERGGKPIMPSHSPYSIEDKELRDRTIAQHGEEIVYNYGLPIGKNKLFIYRITRAFSDGETIEYTWEQVKERCKQLKLSYVPEVVIIDKTAFDNKEVLLQHLKSIGDGPSMKSAKTPKEGICVRAEFETFKTPVFFKYKTFLFKLLEGHIKDQGIMDTEELN